MQRHSSPSSFPNRRAWLFTRRINDMGRYRIDSLISVGGMDSVYRGVLAGAAEFSRLVATKRLHPQLAGDSQLRPRLAKEAGFNARVMHPNVAQLVDVVESAGELWLIVEYIDGETLHALQAEIGGARRVLPLDVVAGVMSGVLEGLHAAHERVDASGARLGIVHGDISPQNLMIRRCAVPTNLGPDGVQHFKKESQ